MPRALTSASGPTDWNEALDIISFSSPEQVPYFDLFESLECMVSSIKF
jgi:hypothetical protein